MPDQSQLDQCYFVNADVYNCPFCNRRHVSYSVYREVDFDWTEAKNCRAFFIQCHSCRKRSMHLTFKALDTESSILFENERRRRFRISEQTDAEASLDQFFFYSVPTSFFVLDARVKAVLRELLTEAEGCLKSNFLTGASACARKIVYELAVLEKASGDDYESRIKSLKTIHADVEPEFFDTLLTIQQLTSEKVHENSYDGWDAKHLRIILAALREVLHELYVAPAIREDRRKSILNLKDELSPGLAPPPAPTDTGV